MKGNPLDVKIYVFGFFKNYILFIVFDFVFLLVYWYEKILIEIGFLTEFTFHLPDHKQLFKFK